LLRRGLYMPWELATFFDPDFVRDGWAALDTIARLEASTTDIGSPRGRVTALETTWYMRNQLLRDTDWASMSHSLEVRVPLVDWSLWRDAAALISADPSLDKRAMAATPRLALPAAVVERRKTGFMTPTRE